MHQGLYKLVENLVTGVLSWWVKPDVLPYQPQRMIDPGLPVLYVLEKGGWADRAALKIISKRFDLPDPSKPLYYGSTKEASSIDVLKHRRGVLFRRYRLVNSQRLLRLINTRLHDTASEIQIVPVAVYWGRAPDKEQSLWSVFFSENWQIGGRTRKLITTLIYGRDTLLAISEPLSMNSLIDSAFDTTRSNGNTTGEPGVPGAAAQTTASFELSKTLSPERLQHKLSRILRVHFRQRRIASLGPDQSHRRMLVSHVLADPGVRAAIQHSAQEHNKSTDRMLTRANKYALEIAADVSYPTVRVLHRVMNRLWTELYDGVELSGIDRLKSVADGHELIYVPCHRSHIDYLLLSYILYINGFSLPHIAAGINLNLPVVGGLLRRGGAFFLRRSFAGNKLYAAVFNAYLKEILQRGHALEYFVEGGRSRTGRSLPPKGGMLAMTAHAYLRNPRTPVVFIPVYFGYERLLEGRAFTSELAGGKKQKESIFALLKSLKTLREKYGRVYVNFGEPIELNALLDQHRQSWRSETIELERPAWLKAVVDDLGVNIMQNINGAACITPVSLLAMGLLSTSQGKLGQADLIDQMQMYHTLFSASAAGTTAIVPDIDFAQAIEHGKTLGFIQTTQDPLGTLVSIRPGMAAPMTYFRNNVQHLITIPALLACCFTSKVRQSREQLLLLVEYAYPFLHNELYLPSQSIEQSLDDALNAMVSSRLIRLEPSTAEEPLFRRAGAGSMEAVTLIRLTESVMPALERYFLAASVIIQQGEDGLTLDTLAMQCEACAERLAITHGRDVGDLYDKHLHKAMITTLIETEFAAVEQTQIVATDKLIRISREARLLVSDQMRQAIMHSAQHFKSG